ncbi:hypothetical protein J5N97_020250 [Dioscorea zingiberensis]|uniref:AB hydrolase-1 domain-containing protein n=1 Tax=Dioscorea zingiberensis TaxID=325984 RepID=A0A9D5CFF3_9LILI|nr:hypothetical protein J5N97_020250 [Dioscorea zingiberensis]
MDLTGCGIDSRSIDEVKSVHDYVKPLMEVMTALPQDEKVVIVGHSLGGMSISFAIRAFQEKITAAVFAASFISSTDSPLSECFVESYQRTSGGTWLDSKLFFDEGLENLPTAVLFGKQLLTKKMYQFCPLEVTNDNPQKETSSITPPTDASSSEQISHQGKGANKGKNKTVVVPSGRKKKDASCYGPIKVLRARRVEERTQRQNENLSQHSTSALEAPEISTQQSITNAATGENFLKSAASE